MAETTPSSSSSPGIPSLRSLWAPMAKKTALYPRSKRSASLISSPMQTPVLTSIPRSRIAWISSSNTSFGRRYAGTPTLNMPPKTGNASKMVTWWPRRAKSWAAASPAGPEPTTATLCPVDSLGCALYPPFLDPSAANRFSAAIAMGSSTWPRLQAASHGWVQIRPHTPGKGFSFLIEAKASSNFLSAMSWIYPRASVRIGQAN